MKKLTALFLAVLLLLNFTVVICSAEEEAPETEEIIEEYTNTQSASTSLSISNSGTTTVGITCIGLIGTTHISSITYLEKWNGSAWVRISINGASQISDGVSAGFLSRTYTTTVGSGQYRATAVFTVTNGSNETVTVRSNTVTH